MRRDLLLFGLIFSVGCGQEIVVVQCDGHVPEGVDGGSVSDAGTTADAGDVTTDGGDITRDAGNMTPDAGDPGCPGGSPYCITNLVASTTRADVRQPVTITPELDNPGGAVLTITANQAEIQTTRRTGLPALVLADISVMLEVSGGIVTFSVLDVPTWFSTTTFTIRVHAQATGGPDVFAETDVTVVGNVVFADNNSVYAVTSGGTPATSLNFTFGRLLDGDSFVRTPADVLMARDGTLLVLDRGTTPQRLKQFELSGENVLLQEFEFEKGGVEFLDTGFAYGMTQMDDGRFVVIDSRTGRTPVVRFVIFEESGAYVRSFSPLSTTVRFDGVAPGPNNTFYACESAGGMRRIVQYDPVSASEVGVLATEIISMDGITRANDGSYYVGTEGTIARLSPTGARMMVNMVPGSTFDDWEFLSPFGPTGIVATTPVQSETTNIVRIEGTTALGWFRLPSVGNPTRTPQGIAHLE